jgi:tRNA threonylcarbamoyladenosine biosynthesis protein TsaE
MNKFSSHSIEETGKIAQEWLKTITPADKATVVGLSGHLGAGKTAFVKCAAKTLGITETVTSPTFVIMKTYPLEKQKWQRLIHIDAYRLEKGAELGVIGFSRLVNNPANLIMIEWPEQVESVLVGLERVQRISFTIKSSDEKDKVHEIIFDYK